MPAAGAFAPPIRAASSVNYRYDAAGRLAELTDGGNQRLVLYQYDAAGRLVSETRGNGVMTTYEYDAADQLLHLIHRAPDGSILSRFDYTYDDTGRRTSMTTLEGTTEYVYDAAGQLILASLPGGRIIRYEYDAAGNRREVSDNGVTTAYTVNEMNQYLSVRLDQPGIRRRRQPGLQRPVRAARRVTPMTPRGDWSASSLPRERGPTSTTSSAIARRPSTTAFARST